MKTFGTFLIFLSLILFVLWGGHEVFFELPSSGGNHSHSSIDDIFNVLLGVIWRIILAILLFIPAMIYKGLYWLIFMNEPIPGDFTPFLLAIVLFVTGFILVFMHKVVFSSGNTAKSNDKIRNHEQNINIGNTKKITHDNKPEQTFYHKVIRQEKNYARCHKCDRVTEQCQYPYHYNKSNYCINCNGGPGYKFECTECYHDQN